MSEIYSFCKIWNLIKRLEHKAIVKYLKYTMQFEKTIGMVELHVLCCLPEARRDFHPRRGLQLSAVP